MGYSIGDLEAGKFVESKKAEKSTVRTQIVNTSDNIIPVFIDFQWDTVNETEPDTITEVYTFKLGLTVVKTITLTYFDASKARLVQVTKV